MTSKSIFHHLGILALAACSSFAQGAAPDSRFQAHCEKKLARTNIKIEVRPAKVAIDHTKSIAELTQMANRMQDFTVGLTQSTMGTSARWKNNSIVDNRRDMACMRPDITIILSIKPHTVYVAREFAAGSCAYQEILAHEQAHVRVNEQYLASTGKWLSENLKKHFGNQIYYGQYDLLSSQLSQAIEQGWIADAQAVYQENKIAHERIDSPQEYARTSAACNGAIDSALRRFK